ncbi:MAG: heavy metal translocating P-type ATPase, partial [Pirellulales bacterium]|nr:heavy metal translocating P-type ATPase [Pirellulales bacterium]
MPVALYEPEHSEQFCCAGCRTAYAIIRQYDLDDYYAVRRASTGAAQAATGQGGAYDEMDDPYFAEQHVTCTALGANQVQLYLQGVHCAACVWLVERLPRVVPGAIEARLNLGRSTVDLTWDPQQVTLAQIARALDRFGYAPHPVNSDLNALAFRREDRAWLVKLAIAGACAGNAMLIAFALYAGMFSTMATGHANLFRWASALVGGVALLGPGAVFFRGAWAALRTRTPHMDVPIALGLAAGGIAGVINTVLGIGEIYFDSLAVLVFFLLLGRWIQFRQQRHAADSVALLRCLTPRLAHRVEEDQVRSIPLDALRPGDLAEVRVGELVPADGVVTSGQSTLDQAILTGEATPVTVGPGEAIVAGATNLSAPLRLRVEAVGYDTRVGRLLRLVEQATAEKTPLLRLADRMSGYFVAVVLVLAVGTLAWWWVHRDWSVAIENAVALLIVSCPCALGLATPLALAVAYGRAARRGILIKSGDVLEHLARPGRIWLDKTGTLTAGKLRVLRFIGEGGWRPHVALLERSATHPLAQALARDLAVDMRAAELASLEVERFEQIHGQGIVGRVAGHELVVGSAVLLADRQIALGDELAGHLPRLAAEGLTPVLIAGDGAGVALAALGDELRADALPSVEALRALGWDVGILSGDHPLLVER